MSTAENKRESKISIGDPRYLSLAVTLWRGDSSSKEPKIFHDVQSNRKALLLRTMSRRIKLNSCKHTNLSPDIMKGI